MGFAGDRRPVAPVTSPPNFAAPRLPGPTCADTRCDRTGHIPHDVLRTIPDANDVLPHDASDGLKEVEAAGSVHSFR